MRDSGRIREGAETISVFGSVESGVPEEHLSQNLEELCHHHTVPPIPSLLSFLFGIAPTSRKCSLLLRVLGRHASSPTFLRKEPGSDLESWQWPPKGAAPRQEGRLACRLGKDKGFLCSKQVPRASCSSPSGSDQQDGTAQAEGSPQGGTPCPTEGGESGMGRRGDRKSCLGRSAGAPPADSGERGSDRRPFSPPALPPWASLAPSIILFVLLLLASLA